MRAIYFILFCTSLKILVAYPVDYDEAIVNITRKALDDLQILLNNILGDIHLEFITKTTAIRNDTQEKMDNAYNTFLQHKVEIQTFAANANNTNITRCTQENDIVLPETFRINFYEICERSASAYGYNFRRLEENKRGHYYYERRVELLNNLESCLNVDDPQPYICAGLVASTLQEVERISPEVKAQPLHFNAELNKQLLALTECASEQISLYVQRLNVWHDSFVACATDLINVNGKY